MSLTPEEEAAGARLDLYNGRAYHPVNDPYAFDRGGGPAGVFVQMLKDVAAWGRAVMRVTARGASDAEASGRSAADAAASAEAAAASAERAQTWDPAGYARLASPALTGNPTAPTAPAGDRDTTIANTEHVAREAKRIAYETARYYGY